MLDIATAITSASEVGDTERQAHAMDQLRALYESHAAAGAVDPFLTEALADFEDDPTRRVELYRLSLLQSPAFSGEPLYTKRIGLAESLIELGDLADVPTLLSEARIEAAEVSDEFELEHIDALLR
ncbi:MAG: hypothetical protein FIA97_14485 [Methylococcaceae bacterium]|nr:hypothetical protein [Methylococcaceae bacterium]